MSLDDRQKSFVDYLLSLAYEGQEDRGALADLRSGLGKEPGKMARVHKYVVPYLPEKRYNDRWYYVVAALFGLYPKHKNDRSLGTAFGALRSTSDSIEARFVALLNSHPDDLDGHLRHTVSLLKSHDKPFNWSRLFNDVLNWDDPEGRVQLKWAQDFYRNSEDSSFSVDSKTTIKGEV